MKVGFRVRQRTRQVDASIIAEFRGIPVANVSDSMFRLSAGGAALRPMHAGGDMAGPAFTRRSISRRPATSSSWTPAAC